MVGGRIIVPHRRRILRAGAGVSDLWTTWDESSEDTLSVDQDGDGVEDTCICFFENTSAGGDETGRGRGLSGADLVLAQAGNIAGASGSPPYRAIDGSNDYFSFTTTLRDSLNGESEWTVIVKLDNYVLSATYGQVLTGPSEIWMREYTNNKCAFYSPARGLNNTMTTDDIPAGTLSWWCMWCDGSDVRAGIATGSKPTKWSDFSSGLRVGPTGAAENGTTGSDRVIFARNTTPDYPAECDGYYFLVSSTCLIDNSA